MLARIYSSAVLGIDAFPVEVEVDIAHGLPSFSIVGLPETAVKESKERVKSAIKNSGFKFPGDRITVNLAPAHIKKEGTGFDLPIALGILTATNTIPAQSVDRFWITGEVSLDGRIKPVNGSLPMALAARDANHEHIIVPAENGPEAAVVNGISVIPVNTLAQLVEYLNDSLQITPEKVDIQSILDHKGSCRRDLAEVMGQQHVKRAMEVTAAGGHNLLMIGPPGSGKSMLAKRLPSILPPIRFEEAIETTKIFSVVGQLPGNQALITSRPFRCPHHTISDAGLIGGGHLPRPGEVSLAHNGVLFLDELPEFRKHVLEVLRQPLEDARVTISRAASSITYPSRFMLVAAMNPCPCGYLSDPKNACVCTPHQIQRYRSRISGPLLDRIDIHVDVPAVPYKELAGRAGSEGSAAIKQRVQEARRIQHKRFKHIRIHCNAQMTGRHIRMHCPIDSAGSMLLETAVDRLGLSARAYSRILKIARTIADLAGKDRIDTEHLSEAVQYRSLDRGQV